MNRAELVRTLELIKPALASNNMVPIFQCFTFLNNGTVSAYDDEIAVVGPCELEENIGVHGNTILGLLSNSGAEEVDFSLAADTLTIKCGKTVSKLPYQPFENFIFKEPSQKWDYKIPFTESLFDAFKMCLETVSKDVTQTALLGITIERDKMYSCDSDAVTRVQLKHGGKGRVLMSTPFCEAVVRLWSSLAVTTGKLQFSDDWVYAEFGEWSVYGRILEITSPIDFEALIKKSIKGKAATQALPDGFSEALSRARVLSDPESQKTVMTVSKGRLQILTETHMGEVKDDLPLKGHPDVKAHVNASHLQRAIQYCDQVAILEGCTVFEKTPDVFQLVSNMG